MDLLFRNHLMSIQNQLILIVFFILFIFKFLEGLNEISLMSQLSFKFYNQVLELYLHLFIFIN
jgi:hypothetical protein